MRICSRCKLDQDMEPAKHLCPTCKEAAIAKAAANRRQKVGAWKKANAAKVNAQNRARYHANGRKGRP